MSLNRRASFFLAGNEIPGKGWCKGSESGAKAGGKAGANVKAGAACGGFVGRLVGSASGPLLKTYVCTSRCGKVISLQSPTDC